MRGTYELWEGFFRGASDCRRWVFQCSRVAGIRSPQCPALSIGVVLHFDCQGWWMEWCGCSLWADESVGS
ncbi:hypothetical protein L484_028082 [Morus notabilis]|uniref:Uncharacterized protein n=1 Tax=Morus notabilis TaxID=981085 RepID=W9SG13_9ROSA|nr:hypothetical protein L484_028082 [Morus notabilis]